MAVKAGCSLRKLALIHGDIINTKIFGVKRSDKVRIGITRNQLQPKPVLICVEKWPDR